ncbi:MAG: MFS transporter [Glaciimonas sp.]|nr:MFS transporter [Glaciimonas sp.]
MSINQHQNLKQNSSLALRVFIIFSLGYFVSYLARGINLPLSPLLSSEIGLSPSQLGLLTSIYFFSFAACQLPLGILLDRFGARKVLAAMMLLAAAGAIVSANAHSFGALVVGRLLLGVGTSACMMAGLKAVVTWFHHDQLPLMSGALYAIGGLGAVVTGTPIAWALGFTSWRVLFVLLAIIIAAIVFALYFWVPEKRERHPKTTLTSQLQGVGQVFSSPIFWRTAPLVMVTQGVFLGVQGLWAGPYLRDVAHMSAASVANTVAIIGVAMVVGAAGFGWLARGLQAKGISIHTTAGVGIMAFIITQLLIVFAVPLPAWLLWSLYGIFGTASILPYASLSKEFPAELGGRVSTGLTLTIFIGAFIVQYGFGLLLDASPHEGNHYAESAHRMSWLIALAVQICAYAWYCKPAMRRVAVPTVPA